MSETLPSLLAVRAERSPAAIALRQKRLGIWQEVTWEQYLAGVQAITLALLELGLQPGEVVALMGGQRVQWLEIELAVQAAAGIVAPLYSYLAPAELAGLLRACDARFVIVEGQEQVDSLLRIRDELPALERVIYWDPRGMRAYADPWLLPLRQVSGEPAPSARERFGAAVSELQPEATAEIVFTQGTDGGPRGLRLSHANLLEAARAFVEAEQLDSRSEFISFAANAWIGDRAFATAAALVAGYAVNLPEEPNTVLQDLQEIGPRLLIAPPLAWQRLSALAATRTEGSGRLRRSLYRAMLDAARRARNQRDAGRALPLDMRIQALLAELLVCRPVRDHLGLLRVRHAYSAGAPLAEEAAAFLRSIGVSLKQVYLITAAAGPVAAGQNNAGHALPRVELIITAQGEVLVRGPGVAQTYADGGAVASQDGWLATGDLGRWEPDGTLTLLGRTKGVLRLSDGTEVLPSTIERRLTASPYVRHAVVLADGQPCVSALIAIDGPAVNAWADRRGIAATTYKQLSEQEDVRRLVNAAVETANAHLPDGQQVQRFAIFDRELSVAEGELTPLGSVRRAAVIAHWAPLIEALRGMVDAAGTGPAVMQIG